jgi:hypothetical protein
MMTTPRFDVAAADPYDDRWIGYTDAEGCHTSDHRS